MRRRTVLLGTPAFSQHFDSGLFWLDAFTRAGYPCLVWDWRMNREPPEADYDAAFILKGLTVDPSILKPPRIVYYPDDLKRTPGFESILRGYDIVASPLFPSPKGHMWVPTGYQPFIHRRVECEYVRDVVFIGTCTDRKVPYILALLNNSLMKVEDVFGNGWSFQLQGKTYDSSPVYLYEYVRQLSASRISINLHRDKVGVNRRLFESIMCGFTLTDDVPGVRDVLRDVSGDCCFDSVDKLVDMIRYYLSHEKERIAVWESQKKAIELFSYQDAVEKIMGWMGI